MPKLHSLKDGEQEFTAVWVNYGPEICTDGLFCLSAWLDLQKNNSEDMRIRALAKHTKGGDGYVFPIKNTTSSVVSIDDEYFEFTTDEDEKRVISFAVDCVIPYVQFQIQAGVVGGSPGKILNSKYIGK